MIENATSESNATETRFAIYDDETDDTSAAASYFMYKFGTYICICLRFLQVIYLFGIQMNFFVKISSGAI